MQQLTIHEMEIINLRNNKLSWTEKLELAKAMGAIERRCRDFYEDTVGTTGDLGKQLRILLEELCADSPDPVEHSVRSASPVRCPSEPPTPTPTARQGSLREQQEAAFRAQTQSGLPRVQPSSSGSLDNIGPGAPLAPFSFLSLVPFKSTQETSLLTLIRVNAPHLATGDMRRRWGNSGAQS
ncbi:hypothetical protein PHLGIDRAFT_270615 [Phlebiopsis gigantea 11061_1 CR5-6]|uniref:Uncharacterized protein n=1 Tax=Phlebiopsis gigantea (strain 11061_1 CR5-6) TaxID=745531 RepID=A0A0C3S173_PHLG1|nr:hypothetical protein PHLGIDRAFT_270615 [Phlebiopsis gigantea 11061_1 CR5-6]